MPWREELSHRVESFRRRRARLRHGRDSDENLDLDFERDGDLGGPAVLDAKVLEFPRSSENLDVEFDSLPGAEGELPMVETVPLEKPGETARNLSSAAIQAGEIPLEQDTLESEPVEILVGFPEPPTPLVAAEASPLMLPLAPLGPRFLAGVADAFVLLLGGGLFALIFWRAGGQMSPLPLNLAVLAFIIVFFILVYFGSFTALTATTPGLLWMRLEVRNWSGTHPTGREAFWRAFGYLVSISALMLGFLWAAVDSEGMTWHDRMSGTFIAPTS